MYANALNNTPSILTLVCTWYEESHPWVFLRLQEYFCDSEATKIASKVMPQILPPILLGSKLFRLDQCDRSIVEFVWPWTLL